jgi:hypothetical protein
MALVDLTPIRIRGSHIDSSAAPPVVNTDLQWASVSHKQLDQVPSGCYCQFMYLDLQTIACVLYRAHQVASHVLVSTWLATLSRACARAI